jgi:hypothetical protein
MEVFSKIAGGAMEKRLGDLKSAYSHWITVEQYFDHPKMKKHYNSLIQLLSGFVHESAIEFNLQQWAHNESFRTNH